jgi:hypothetical protein
MSRRTAAVLAWSVGGLTIASMAFTIALYVANRSDAVRLPYFLVPEATAVLVGTLISVLRPRNPVGWLILGHTVCFTFGEFSRQYAIYGLLTNPGSLPMAEAMAWPPYWVWYPGIILVFSFLPLYFPNGRLVSPRWRVVTWLALVVGLLETIVAAVRPGDAETPGVPNPIGIESLQGGGVLTEVVSLMWLPLGALSAASLVVRFRRSRDAQRQQIKWVVYAVVLVALYALADQFVLQTRHSSIADVIFFLVFFEALWLAIAVAVLRYRLYDIDIVINRTLVYGTLSVTLAALYPRRRGRDPGCARRHHQPGADAARRRRFHAGYSRALQPLEATHPGVHRPQLLQEEVRRC